jgi:hypothetical protein
MPDGKSMTGNKLPVRLSFFKKSTCVLFTVAAGFLLAGCSHTEETSAYEWTPDHMQVGVRWQPFPNRPENNAYDATRPVITEDSSYVQFWVSWAAAEPTRDHTDYADNPSPYLREIEAAVDACVAEGLKVEFVFWHTPAWASVSGEAGGRKPKKNQYKAYVQRIARHFKGRVHSYQLYHEANGVYHFYDGDLKTLISEIFIKGAKGIRTVYQARPAEPVILSTSGCSPCEECPPLNGLTWGGGRGVSEFYDRLIESRKMMQLVDGLNLNVSDQNDGYGIMDGSYVPSVWGNYDLARGKLDAAGYRNKAVFAAESWISWDAGISATDVNGDGMTNEVDALRKTVTIMGQCLQRGLNTMNLPWSDNMSDWGMGLTKRRDYNGRIKTLQPDIVLPASDGGADIVSRKVQLIGTDSTFTIADGMGDIFTVENYINPPDPNHLHYYIWKWYAQIAGGSDEVIRHALAGEIGNDITVKGPAFTGAERYRISSYNRSQNHFTVLVYAGGANGTTWATVSIPSTIQDGYHYNNDFSRKDFRGEGFADGESYRARITTRDISMKDGQDIHPVTFETPAVTVSNQTLTITIPEMNRFTTVEFIKAGSE